MEVKIWTVATHDNNVELPSEVKTFGTKDEAYDELMLKLEIATLHKWDTSHKENGGKFILICSENNKIVRVHILESHIVKIPE